MDNSTGQGVAVVISCECTPHHNWMSFACWVSLNKNLPDAKVAVVATRGLGGNFFLWTKGCKVPFCYHSPLDGPRKSWHAQVAMSLGVAHLPIFVIEPHVLAIREFGQSFTDNSTSPGGDVWLLKDGTSQPVAIDETLCRPARGDDFTTFVSYAEGWGKFVTADCINKGDYPFRRAERFHSGDVMTLNEAKILDLWKRMDRLFTAVSRG